MRQDDLLRGAMLGAGMMYLLDPDRGKRRRAQLRDKLGSQLNRTVDMAGTAARDLGNRSRGLVARGRSRLRSGTAPERVLEARVRSRLGRLVSHPGAIDVTAEGHSILLCGPVLADEQQRLIDGVASVRGVAEVVDRLDVHERPTHVPALQGEATRPEAEFELLQENWSPAARALMSALGGVLIARGRRGSGPADLALTVIGTSVLARAITNLQMRRLTGIGAGRRAVEIRKTVNIDAPLEEVFAFCGDYENFPKFMGHLEEVRPTGDGRYHWVAQVPGGFPVAWDSETTVFEQNRVIGWKSIGSSPVRHAGIARFQPNEKGGTRIDIHLSYNPPAGAIGHAALSLLGANPRRAFDEDMVRLKSLLEEGRKTSDGERVAREGVRTVDG